MGNFGDRMKMLEKIECSRKLIPLLPVCIRLDGKNFSKFTKGLDKPFDSRLIIIMEQLTKYLVQETNAIIGYAQSDEINLILYTPDYKSLIYFDGKIHKINSVLAAVASVKFKDLIADKLPEKKDQLAVFDCRTWNVPTREEAVNNLIWRELDAIRNSILSAGQTHFSHKEMQNKKCEQVLLDLKNIGIEWEMYPNYFKYGIFIQRYKTMRKFTTSEIYKLPPKHEARTNPDLKVERSEIRKINISPLSNVENRVEVIFENQKSKLKKT